MLSIIIPAFKEPYMNKTIDSLLDNAVGEIEIIPVFDGRLPDEPVRVNPRVRPIYLPKHTGMRGCINSGIHAASGEFIMKTDAHCIFARGYDLELTNHPENWLMVPRRYSLDEKTWSPNKRKVVDFHQVTFPGTLDRETQGITFHVVPWHNRGREDILIDDTMIIQGSCWVANRKYFIQHVGFLDDVHYGTFIQEQQEIAFKYWLGGGEVKANKKTWYAHLSKRPHHYKNQVFSRIHKKDQEWVEGNLWGTRHWMNDEEPNMVHPFAWLIEKFWPIPTWPENWKEIWKHL